MCKKREIVKDSSRGVLEKTICDIKFDSYFRQVGGFFPGTPVSSTNKTDHHEVTEILLKVALKTINLNLKPILFR